MPADETTVIKRITEILNVCAPGTFSATVASVNLDRNATAIAESAREAAMMIGRAIVVNPKHVHRNAYVSSAGVTLSHQGELPDMAGEMDLVEIQPYSGAAWQTGAPRDVQQIESWRLNPFDLYDSVAHNASGSALGGYYAIANGRFYFTGFAARGYFPEISRDTITALIPDEYESTWVALGVAFTLKEGDNMRPIGGFYYNHGIQDLAAISAMSIVAPLPPPAAARRDRGNG
jgi:hypothetical protein